MDKIDMLNELMKEMNVELKMVMVNFRELAQMSPQMRIAIRAFYRNKFVMQQLQKTVKELSEFLSNENIEKISKSEIGDMSFLISRFHSQMEIAHGTEQGLITGVFAVPALKNQLEKEEAAKAKVQ